MLTAKECLERYGQPDIKFERKQMGLFLMPFEWSFYNMPPKIYMNRSMIDPFNRALINVVTRDLVHAIKTWDGCFNIRNKRGQSSMSLHSWGVAFDINAAWNQFGKKPTMDKRLVKCFIDAGFDWGGTWTKPDGMHFQLAKLPPVPLIKVTL